MYLMFNVLCQVITTIIMIKMVTRTRLTYGLIHTDCDSSVQYSYNSGPPIVWHIYIELYAIRSSAFDVT